MRGIAHYRVAIVLMTALSTAAGCCDSDPQCEPPVSSDVVPVSAARLPAAWTTPGAGTMRIVVTTGPYRVTDFAVEQVRAAMSQQAALATDVVTGGDTGLPGSGLLDYRQVVQAGEAQIPSGTDPVIVIVVVDSATFPDSTFGFTQFESASRPIAVMGLYRGPMSAAAIGPIPLEAIESTVAVHEVGHWLGVPARDYHTSAIDGMHCTNARCVMFKGARSGLCAVTANLCTGLPMRFCADCAEELAEMARRRNQQP